MRWFFWMPIHDIDCDFRLIRKGLLQELDLKCSSGAICIELIKKAQMTGAKFRQISVHHFERRFGVSQFFRVERILNTLGEILWLWVNLMIVKKLHSPKLPNYNRLRYNRSHEEKKQFNPTFTNP